MVGVVIHYDTSAMKRVRLTQIQYEKWDFRLKPSDGDAHKPLKANFGGGGRDRTLSAKMWRRQADRKRERARKRNRTQMAPEV